MDPNVKLGKEMRATSRALEALALKSPDGFAKGKRAASMIHRIKALAEAMTIPGEGSQAKKAES